MLKVLPPIIGVIIFSSSLNAATVKWDGDGGDDLWTTASNWIGDAVPLAGDDVVLDNSVLTGNYTVEFPDATFSIVINSFTITPADANVITFHLPPTNTANPAFSVTGAGDAVVLDSGAVFINSSGATKGTPVTVGAANFFRINNGAKYVHNTSRGHTTYLVARLSTVAGTEHGIFEFDIPGAGSNTISISGRTYGDLRLSSAASDGTVTYIGSGGKPLIINGDFQINTGVTFSISMTANVIVRGSYIQQNASVFNIQNSSTAGDNNIVQLMGNVESAGEITEKGTYLPVIELAGTTNQEVNITGSITNSVIVRIDNSSGVTLLSTLLIPYELDLQNGKIKTSATNILKILDNAIYTGGSSSGFIDGPMAKVGDDETFTFPVGKGTIYAPISFSTSDLSVTDEFTAEYMRSNPQNLKGTNYEAPFDHISYMEYWKLEQTVNVLASPISVTLSITPYSFARVLATTYITNYNESGGQWKNSGTMTRESGIPDPPNITGTIQSNPLNQLGLFTLATTDPFLTNPLPVTLIAFRAIKSGMNSAEISWEVAGDVNDIIQFEVQRSENGKDFSGVASIYSSLNKSTYLLRDKLMPSRTWYRVKIVNKAGEIIYSKTVFVSNRLVNALITIAPNPSRGKTAMMLIAKEKSIVNVLIYDFSGKLLIKLPAQIIVGSNRIALPTDKLPPGIFTIAVVGRYTSRVLQFVKL